VVRAAGRLAEFQHINASGQASTGNRGLTVTAAATVSLTVIAALVVIVTVIGTVCCYCYFDRDC